MPGRGVVTHRYRCLHPCLRPRLSEPLGREVVIHRYHCLRHCLHPGLSVQASRSHMRWNLPHILTLFTVSPLMHKAGGYIKYERYHKYLQFRQFLTKTAAHFKPNSQNPWQLGFFLCPQMQEMNIIGRKPQYMYIYVILQSC